MYRALQVNDAKNIPIRKAGENMVRGAAVVVDRTDDTLVLATATQGISLLDVAPNFDGVNAIIAPTDAGYEEVKAGQTVLQVPTYALESYATTEVDAGLTKGDLVKAVAGKFVKAVAGDVCSMSYGGTYVDPTGLSMHQIDVLEAPKQA